MCRSFVCRTGERSPRLVQYSTLPLSIQGPQCDSHRCDSTHHSRLFIRVSASASEKRSWREGSVCVRARQPLYLRMSDGWPSPFLARVCMNMFCCFSPAHNTTGRIVLYSVHPSFCQSFLPSQGALHPAPCARSLHDLQSNARSYRQDAGCATVRSRLLLLSRLVYDGQPSPPPRSADSYLRLA